MATKDDKDAQRQKDEFFGLMDEWYDRRVAQNNATRTDPAPEPPAPAAPAAPEPPAEPKKITGIPAVDKVIGSLFAEI